MSLLDFVLVSGLLLANAFFVAAEFALVKVRSSQIDELVGRGYWAARIAEKVLSRLDAYISASQLGITLASLGLGYVIEESVKPVFERMLEGFGLEATSQLAGMASISLAPALAFLVVTTLHIVVGELVPKSLAIRSARLLALWTAPPLMAFYYVFYPAIVMLNLCSELVLRLMGLGRVSEQEIGHTEEELRTILSESVETGQIKAGERDLIENVLNLENKDARRIMVPAPDVVYLSLKRSYKENLSLAKRYGHTRYPLCELDLTNILGMIHVKDLFWAHSHSNGTVDLTKLTRKVPFLHEHIPLDKLLKEFQRQNVHLAMLVDEHGTVVGMVTLENVLEELVGPILDEFDKEERPWVETLEEGVYRVQGLCPVDEFFRTLGLEPPETEADTIGGLIVDRLGRLARSDDVVWQGDYQFQVDQADPTRIRSITIRHRAKVSELDPDDQVTEAESSRAAESSPETS